MIENLNKPELQAGYQTLPSFDGSPASKHQLREEDVLAVHAALASGRPLLVLGEPGTGKTQLARAAAVGLERHFVSHTMDAHTEAQDLFWKLDAVRRLAEAQLWSAKLASLRVLSPDLAPEPPRNIEILLQSDQFKQASGHLDKELDELNFVVPGILWWGLNWTQAKKQHQHACHIDPRPCASWFEGHSGTVMLLDEIDKADPVLPNALLEALTGSFRGPRGLMSIEKSPSERPPLVVITSNQEREMPHAFMRRCIVLHLTLPDEPEELKQLLIDRGQSHAEAWEGLKPDQDVLEYAATLLVAERSQHGRRRRAGQAEFLDLLRATCELQPDNKKRLKLLDDLAPFVLKKYKKGA